jgi:hypothetical protein
VGFNRLVDSRCVANVIVGTLYADHTGDIFVLCSEVLEKVTPFSPYFLTVQ